MTTVLRNYHLYGSLAKKHGSKPYQLASHTLKQGFLALCGSLPDFEDDCFECREVIFLARRGVQLDPVEMPFLDSELGDATDVYIVPKAQGSGIEIAAWALGVAATSTAAIVVGTIINIALTIAISAVVAALSPKPANSNDGASTKASRIFNGPMLMTDAGAAIPKGYGVCMGNGYLISQGIGSKDINLYE